MITDALDSFFGLKTHQRLIKNNIDTSPLLAEFEHARNTMRSLRKHPFFSDSSIYSMRFAQLEGIKGNVWYGNILKNATTDNYAHLPMLARWLEEFAREQKGTLGWVLISILTPEGQIRAHTDDGRYFAKHDRYHLILQSGGSLVLNGGQSAIYKEGELWRFNNKVLHKVLNQSDKERIHVLIDILPDSKFARAKNYIWWLYWGLRPGRLLHYYIGRRVKK